MNLALNLSVAVKQFTAPEELRESLNFEKDWLFLNELTPTE
jgi:hypothetical protein